MRALGEDAEALERVQSAWAANQSSAILAAEMIRTYAANGDIEGAEAVYGTFADQGPATALPHARNTLIDALMDAGEDRKARELLERHPPRDVSGQDAIDAAVLARRARQSRLAHRYFVRAADAVQTDPRALLEFAQTKAWLARETPDSRRRLLEEARELLDRVLQMETSATRHAWAWRELARTLHGLRVPLREVEDAYGKAIKLLPNDTRFAEELARIRARRDAY